MTAATALRAQDHDGTWVAALRRPLALCFVASVFALCHPYTGIVGDATIYLGRALADLDPHGLGRDMAFAQDGQSRFSIFARVVTPLVAILGASKAGTVIALCGNGCVFLTLLALARSLAAGRMAFAIMICFCVLPTDYGEPGVFRFSETAAQARPFAEAAVMAAVAALLSGRRRLALLALVGATTIHPVMALAGWGVAFVVLPWNATRRRRIALAAIAVLALAAALTLGALGVPLFDRLLLRVDPLWLSMMTERSRHLFPSRWDGAAFRPLLVQSATLILAASLGSTLRGRVLLAVTASAVAQLALTLLFSDGLHILLALQVQGWRATWLLGVVANCCLPLVTAALWRRGADGRLALAALILAWFLPAGPFAAAALCVAALILIRLGSRISLDPSRAGWAPIAAVALGFALSDWAAPLHFIATTPPGAVVRLLVVLRNGLETLPVCVAVAVWLLAGARIDRTIAGMVALAMATGATTAAAAALWDQRDAGSTFIEGRPEIPGLAALAAGRPPEVLWIDGRAEAWYALGRPQYLSPQQAVGIVFSRPLAMEWRRRATLLRELGLAPHTIFRPGDSLTAADRIEITSAKLDALCGRSDAPGIIVVPDRDDVTLPDLTGTVHWAAPAPIWTPELYDPPRWVATTGWTALACAPRR